VIDTSGRLAAARSGASVGSMVRLAALLGAWTLLLWDLGRLAASLEGFAWWLPLAVAGGVACADFLSGLGHWAFDTWGSPDTKLIGERLLKAFRDHHVTPHDILERSFVDLNGEMAMAALPLLVAAALVPLDGEWWHFTAALLVASCGIGMFTNQFHKWAHMTSPGPPWPARLLQRAGLILGREHHARHHEAPSTNAYCITTGWWNPILERTRFFERLERLVTLVTGAVPRPD
jgi:ubiquitin-conjugating enzyme E2 variant